MKFSEIKSDNKYLKIFLRFPVSSLLSFIIRFFSLYLFVDLLKYDYTSVYLIVYLYVVGQSYLIQKYFVQKSKENNFTKFLFSNIVLGIFEYLMIYFLQIFFNSYYAYMFLVTALRIYLLRFYIYTFKIFKS